MSVPAHTPRNTPAHRHTDLGVTTTSGDRNPGPLLAAAAANPAVSDAALRAYTVLVTVYQRGASAAQVAAAMPATSERQAAQLLGILTGAGLLQKRLRVVGYQPSGARIRRGFYTLAGVNA